jgi:tetratricopeptide (TPR) repeat protein
MIRMRFATKGILFTALVLLVLPARPAAAGALQQDQGKTSYTIPEYNAFQAANAEKDAQARLKLLDDFAAKFPSSTLNQYVFALYYQTYLQLKNYPKTIEYIDKLTGLGDAADLGARLSAFSNRVQVFPFVFNPKMSDAHDQLVKERDAAKQGADLLQKYPKPADSKLTDDQFAEQKKPGIALFDAAAGFADLQLKDFPPAIEAFKTALADDPKDAVSAYRLGVAYLSETPPQSLDGFWYLARSINLKIQGDAQIKDYLRKQILNYEQPQCESLADQQLNELLTLAGITGDRPATYTIPSVADLQKIAGSSTILTVFSDLTAGGDKAKLTWLAVCGAQFPSVAGKIIEVKQGGGFVDFMVFFSASEEELQKATTANMDVKVWTAAPPAGTPNAAQVIPQPDVARLAKDDGILFSGAIVSYDPSPLVLHWDQVKVDPTAIPEKAEPGKHHKVPPKQQ